jgi:hypothetical protein
MVLPPPSRKRLDFELVDLAGLRHVALPEQHADGQDAEGMAAEI